MKKVKDLQFYKKLLPQRITVEIHKAKEGGFWAEIKEFSNCYTQAENFKELVEMVNDAVFNYLEIPNKFHKALNYYLPKEIIEEIDRTKWERLVNEILNKGKLKERIQIFSRS